MPSKRVSTKRLSQHDIAEVVLFQEHLADLNSDMPRVEFYKKWQEYMELSNQELLAILEKVNRA